MNVVTLEILGDLIKSQPDKGSSGRAVGIACEAREAEWNRTGENWTRLRGWNTGRQEAGPVRRGSQAVRALWNVVGTFNSMVNKSRAVNQFSLR